MRSKKQVDEQFRSAYDTYVDNISRFCNIKLKNRDEAQDCVQECFTIFYKKLIEGEQIINISAYLYKIADNLVKEQYRRDEKARNIIPLEEVADQLYTEQNIGYEDIDYDIYAKKIIDCLNENDKELYRLRYDCKKSLQQISKDMNISYFAVAKRLCRMRDKISEIMKEELD